MLKIMEERNNQEFIKNVLANMPSSWLNLTTHRLDIYDEKLAKTQFLEELEILYKNNDTSNQSLYSLHTAYDYIRLGHPLSCILEWGIAQNNKILADHVITFSSKTAPILAILRANLLAKKITDIYYIDDSNSIFDEEILKNIYGYQFNLKKVNNTTEIPLKKNDNSIVLISKQKEFCQFDLALPVDFIINLNSELGSILVINGLSNSNYISDIQHFRRRETIAMTPQNSKVALHTFLLNSTIVSEKTEFNNDKKNVINSIKSITNTNTDALVGSSGLSIQYAIVMGLIHDALENHKGKAIKIIVPPNCYGGTNDQARRVAACLDNVEVMDLPVDGENNMVQSIDIVLGQIAKEDALPFIIAEIPTNPRVEVPDLIKLKEVLSKKRFTESGKNAIEPIFVLDQTFCPNVHFLGEGKILSAIKAISYVSGSKFPSGGKCTAGYCVSNKKGESLMEKIAIHLKLCDNEATPLQYQILAKQLPSMNQRIQDAYRNTRDFVNYINTVLPEAKINFVSEELAEQGFNPSVFSLDLPTKGNTEDERENYKRDLNLKLINLMITEIPNESKYCVSYGQLKGCYWTIPATSTQGTTKEGDKDYIARVALSPDLDLDLHKQVFSTFVKDIFTNKDV